MRIAQVCPRFYPDIGGVETHVYEISKRLVKHFEVEVLTTDPTGRYSKVEEINGFIVRRFKSIAPSNSYYFSLEMYRFLKRHSSDYDIIHAHNYHAFPALFAALTKGRNKLVFTPHYHGKGHSLFRNILHKPYKILAWQILKKADKVICVSNYEKRLILKTFKIDEQKICVIPNGVNLEEFRNIDKIRRHKDKCVKTILYVGRVEKYKGLDFVVKALKLLPENFILEIVGKGNYKPKIVKLVRDLGFSSRVKFYHDLSREKLIGRFANADVLVLLSKHEAYGIVVAEALASKIPCIVANTSALSEWIDNKIVFGIDYPINVNELSRLIQAVCSRNYYKIYTNILTSWDDVAKDIIKIYTNIL